MIFAIIHKQELNNKRTIKKWDRVSLGRRYFFNKYTISEQSLTLEDLLRIYHFSSFILQLRAPRSLNASRKVVTAHKAVQPDIIYQICVTETTASVVSPMVNISMFLFLFYINGDILLSQKINWKTTQQNHAF